LFAVKNGVFGITLLNQTTTSTSSAPANMLSANYNGLASKLSISTYWIYKYLAGTTYSEWSASGSVLVKITGQGFSMKGTAGFDLTNPSETIDNCYPDPVGRFPSVYVSNHRYDFRG
jgi:hypothetical protein